MTRLLLICGSLRRGSFNRKLLGEAERLWTGETVWGEIDMPLYNGDVEDRNGLA